MDPACGSGAFLVGMMQVLSGLHRLICQRLGEPYHDFQVKKRIIGENLFGVDIKDWAVRVAELRLWLSLIIHASVDEVREDPGKPILPNLTFRIQAGDSLVEEIAGRSLSLRGRYSQMSGAVGRQVNRLLDHKRDYYYNRGQVMPPQEIRRLETEVFRAILEDELSQVDRELRRLRAQEQEGFQQELEMVRAGGPAQLGLAQVSPEKARLRREIERLEQERAELVAVRNSTEIERGKGPFLWDIEFAEVFQHKGGFDIVIGNPPYVRQEEIAPLNKDPQAYTTDQWREEKRKYKEALQRSVQTHWGSQVKVGGRADYYVYFYLHGLALLRPGGTFCFITSNSWLDVGYGADLQRFLLTNIEIKDIYDNHAKRSFAASDINTIIVLFRRPAAGADLPGHKARFVAFKRPFEAVLTADNLTLVEWADSIQRTDDLRVYPLSQGELWRAGLGGEEEESRAMALGFGYGQYRDDKWGGKYLRAPDIFFTILEKGKGKLVRLGDIAEVRFGIKTGANEFFYLEATGQPTPPGLVHMRNGAGWEGFIEEEFLKPVVKTAKDSATFLVHRENLKTLLLHCSVPKKALTNTRALDYIGWGESHGFHLVRSVSGRRLWYDVGDKNAADAIILRRIGERMPVFEANGTLEDCVLFGITRKDPGLDVCVFVGLLNATSTRLFIEVMTRQLTGAQAVADTNVYVVKEALVLDPHCLAQEVREKIRDAYFKLRDKPCKSIFDEVGFPKPTRDYSNIRPEEVSLGKVLPDRRELDKVVFEALGLTEEEQLEVYRAVVGLVKDRLSKAGSV